LHLVGILFPHINDDARSKSHQEWLDVEISSSVLYGNTQYTVTIMLHIQRGCLNSRMLQISSSI